MDSGRFSWIQRIHGHKHAKVLESPQLLRYLWLWQINIVWLSVFPCVRYVLCKMKRTSLKCAPFRTRTRRTRPGSYTSQLRLCITMLRSKRQVTSIATKRQNKLNNADHSSISNRRARRSFSHSGLSSSSCRSSSFSSHR